MSPKVQSLVATLVLLAGVAVLFFQHALLARDTAGVTLQLLAVALMVWARLTFGLRSFHATANPTEGGLVTTGPFRFIRHPIYAAILLFVWTGVVANRSTTGVLAAVLVTAMTAARIRAEETLLAQRYPAYAEYSRRTKRLIPAVF